MKKYILPALVIVFVLIADQWLKYWVHAHIPLNTHIVIISNWFQLNYIENNGMAFGFEIGGVYGKVTLTIFRILAVFAIIWYIVKQINIKAPTGFILCVSLILAGAIGNIIDSVFYGVIYQSQNLPLFQGRVIDMLYFPVIDTYLPEWFPFWKGEHFEFFRPVFNIADASISIGIITILIFQKRFFKPHQEEDLYTGDLAVNEMEDSHETISENSNQNTEETPTDNNDNIANSKEDDDSLGQNATENDDSIKN